MKTELEFITECEDLNEGSKLISEKQRIRLLLVTLGACMENMKKLVR